MKFLKAYLISLIYHILLFMLIFILNNGMKDIITMLVYWTIYLSVIVLLISLILESYLKVKDNNKFTVVFIGFLYGIVISILFDGTTATTEIMLHIMFGCIFSIGSLLFTFIRGKSKVKN